MAYQKVKDITYHFDILEDGKSAKIYRIECPEKTTKITIPETVQYNGKNYTVTEISGWEWSKQKKVKIEDKRKKNYGEWVGTSEYEKRTVSCLTSDGEYSNEKIKRVVIPDTVKVISSFTFSKCFKLEKINIPEGVEVLGKYAFYWCPELQEITLPSTIEEIGENCFSKGFGEGADTIITIKNDEGAVKIGNYAIASSFVVKYAGKSSLFQRLFGSKKESEEEPKKAKTVETKSTAAKIEAKTTKKEETKTPKTATTKKEEPPKAATKTATAKKETTAKSKSKDSSVKYGKYEITINEDKSVSVTLKGTLCDNTKEALREVATAAKFKVDDKWSTRQLGAKLVAFLSEK